MVRYVWLLWLVWIPDGPGHPGPTLYLPPEASSPTNRGRYVKGDTDDTGGDVYSSGAKWIFLVGLEFQDTVVGLESSGYLGWSGQKGDTGAGGTLSEPLIDDDKDWLGMI